MGRLPRRTFRIPGRRSSGSALACTASLVFVFACGGCDDDGDEWPGDYGAVLTAIVLDPADDLESGYLGGPAYDVTYPPVDMTKISFGVQGKYFYIRVDWSGTVPTAPVHIAEDSPVEEQTVLGHEVCVDFSWPLPNGCTVFRVGIRYGLRPYLDRDCVSVTAIYGCSGDGDYVGRIEGELGGGGPGHNYVLVRYNASFLGEWFPRGTAVTLRVQSAAGSVDASGNDMYGRFALDTHFDATWVTPW